MEDAHEENKMIYPNNALEKILCMTIGENPPIRPILLSLSWYICNSQKRKKKNTLSVKRPQTHPSTKLTIQLGLLHQQVQTSSFSQPHTHTVSPSRRHSTLYSPITPPSNLQQQPRSYLLTPTKHIIQTSSFHHLHQSFNLTISSSNWTKNPP